MTDAGSRTWTRGCRRCATGYRVAIIAAISSHDGITTADEICLSANGGWFAGTGCAYKLAAGRANDVGIVWIVDGLYEPAIGADSTAQSHDVIVGLQLPVYQGTIPTIQTRQVRYDVGRVFLFEDDSSIRNGSTRGSWNVLVHKDGSDTGTTYQHLTRSGVIRKNVWVDSVYLNITRGGLRIDDETSTPARRSHHREIGEASATPSRAIQGGSSASSGARALQITVVTARAIYDGAVASTVSRTKDETISFRAIEHGTVTITWVGVVSRARERGVVFCARVNKVHARVRRNSSHEPVC